MNQFPQFQANAPALPQLSATRMNMLSDGIRANQIKSGIGYRVSQTPGGTTLAIVKNRYGQMRFKHPFMLSVEYDGSDWNWQVSSYQSSVTDGTNGDVIDLSTALFDTPTAIEATKYIVLQATVGSELALSSWTVLAVDLADADEVNMSALPDPPYTLVVRKSDGEMDVRLVKLTDMTKDQRQQAIDKDRLRTEGQQRSLLDEQSARAAIIDIKAKAVASAYSIKGGVVTFAQGTTLTRKQLASILAQLS